MEERESAQLGAELAATASEGQLARNHEGYSGYTIDYTSANTSGRGAHTRNDLTPNTPDTFNQSANSYNATMVGMVSERAAAGKHVRLMDMHTPFTSNANYSTALLADKLHPNDAGYKLMGQTWYAALGPLRSAVH